MDANDSFVVVGGRKSLPQVHVENEDKSGNLRFRRECSTSSSPSASRSPPADQQSTRTPSYGTPKTITCYTDRRSKTRPSPTLKDLKEGRVEVDDSGYSGWRESSNVKKKLRYDPGSIREEKSANHSNGDDSFWDQVSSPVLDMKKKLQGRPSFLDEGRKSWIQPQHILAGIIMLIIISSLGFAILIGYKHFSEDPNYFNNGKMRSIRYGTEKRLETLRSQGKLIDRDLLDESGDILGGKRASIQYAYELKDGEDAVKNTNLGDPSLRSWGRPISSRRIIQAATHLDLFELAESIDILSKALEEKLKEGSEVPQFRDLKEDIQIRLQNKRRIEEKLGNRVANNRDIDLNRDFKKAGVLDPRHQTQRVVRNTRSAGRKNKRVDADDDKFRFTED